MEEETEIFIYNVCEEHVRVGCAGWTENEGNMKKTVSKHMVTELYMALNKPYNGDDISCNDR